MDRDSFSHISRRELIKYFSATAISSFCPILSSITSAASEPGAGGKLLLLSNPAEDNFLIADINNKKIINSVSPGFYPHSFVANPKDKNRVWCIGYSESTYPAPSYQPKPDVTAEVDISNGRIIRKIESPKHLHYRGHAFFTENADILYVSCMERGTLYGHLLAYESATGKLIDDLKIAEGPVHQCKLLPGGSVLIAVAPKLVNNEEAVSAGGIYHYDLANKKIISSLLTKEINQAVTHFNVLGDGRILASCRVYTRPYSVDGKPTSAPTTAPAALFLLSLEKNSLHKLSFREGLSDTRVPGRIFGLATNEKAGLSVAGDSTNGVILVIDLAKGEIVNQIHDQGCWSIEFNEQRDNFIVAGQHLSFLDGTPTAARQFSLGQSSAHSNFSGAHTLLI